MGNTPISPSPPLQLAFTKLGSGYISAEGEKVNEKVYAGTCDNRSDDLC